jgi:hypothetical protein
MSADNETYVRNASAYTAAVKFTFWLPSASRVISVAELNKYVISQEV